jgi:hypothetical protein
MPGICGVKLHEAFAGSPLHERNKAPMYPGIASTVKEPDASDPEATVKVVEPDGGVGNEIGDATTDWEIVPLEPASVASPAYAAVIV